MDLHTSVSSDSLCAYVCGEGGRDGGGREGGRREEGGRDGVYLCMQYAYNSIIMCLTVH